MSQQEGLMLDELLVYAWLRSLRGLTFIELRKQREVERWLRDNTDGNRRPAWEQQELDG
jgi:hypothetical protein